MAKRKSNKRKPVTEDCQELEEVYIDRKFRNFTIRIYPFPTGLFERLTIQAEEKYPYPNPPTKEIQTLGETEVVDDLEDSEYKAKIIAIDDQRKNYTGTIIFAYLLESCLEVLEKDEMSKSITRLEKIGIEFPEDPTEQEQDFITTHLVRTEDEYTMLVLDSIGMTVTGSEEVAERLNSFQNKMEKRADIVSKPSGIEEK